jgi:hypothetical protein
MPIPFILLELYDMIMDLGIVTCCTHQDGHYMSAFFLCYYALTDSVSLMVNYMVLQEEAKEESDDDMGFSLFD